MVSRQLDDSIWEGGGQKFNRRRATKGARCTRSPARGTARFTTAKPKIGHWVQGPGGPVAQRRLAEKQPGRPGPSVTARVSTATLTPARPEKTDFTLSRLALPFFLFPGLLPLALAGCAEGYSPNTYAASAAQQAAPVQRGVIVGSRPVLISANGTVGAAAGGAAGGVAGAQLSGGPEVTAFGAIGGALVGGIGGAAAEQAVADAKGWEYIVQETGGNLVSVTQTSKVALPVGLHVLVIAGTQQARIVPDYTVQIAATSPAANAPAPVATGMKPAATNATDNAAASNGSTTTPAHVSPAPPAAGAAVPSQAASVTVASSAIAPPAASSATAPPAASSAVAPPAPKPATATPSGGSAATSVQVAPKASSSTPPANSSSAATP